MGDFHVTECPMCDGEGQLLYDEPRPHALGWNMGYIDTVLGDCELCGGTGEVVQPCIDCGEPLTKLDAVYGMLCEDCMEEKCT